MGAAVVAVQAYFLTVRIAGRGEQWLLLWFVMVVKAIGCLGGQSNRNYSAFLSRGGVSRGQ